MVHLSTNIAAPPQRVWQVMTDVDRWAEWTSSVTSIGRMDSGPLALGSRVRISQPQLPPMNWVVTQFEFEWKFTWVARRPLLTVTARHLLQQRGRNSRVSLSVAYDGLLSGIVARSHGPLTHHYLSLEAEGLKTRSEAVPAK
jgi:polyketide cyclase/dehydrase/lipid transport protein